MVLCELCFQAGYEFSVAHCNFQLRNDESERDEDFVRTLANKYQKNIFLKKFDTVEYAATRKISIQLAARELRYAWFDEIMKDEKSIVDHSSSALAYIVTAHHLYDNIETIMMNFFKGTGIAGLRGILPKQGKLVRPLLFARKEAIKEFALSNHLQWVEDSSNNTDKYTRNYFRHQIIPLVEKVFPEAIANLSDNINRFQDIEQLYQQAIDLHLKKLLEQRGSETHIPILKLKKSAPLHSIVFEIIKKYQFSPAQVDELISLMDSDSGKYIQSSTHRIIKNRNWLIISPNETTQAQNILIEQPDGRWTMTEGSLQLETRSAVGFILQKSTLIAQLDAEKIKLPLLLRKWGKGDYFYPLGMKKKKKLARFFIDNKLSQTEKEKTWVLEMNKKIIWVVGMRIDERFKITPQTKKILKISFNK